MSVTYIYEEGAQPCELCWGWTPPDGWDMENILDYLPRGDGWTGLAYPHLVCLESVAAYEEERRKEGWA